MGETPRVLVETILGDIEINVDEVKAPLTSVNFLRYVDVGLYDGTTFFRAVTMDNQPNDAVKIEVIQGGQLDKAREYPPIVHETTVMTGIKHLDGVISMGRLRPGSAASSFFICINDQPELDYGGRRNPDLQGFSAFGKVTQGMDVVRIIHAQPRERQKLAPPIPILKVTRVFSKTN